MQDRKKMKPNEWLETREFLKKIDFMDEYYLVELCKHLANFLKSIPISVLAEWDRKSNDRLYINVGPNSKSFEIDTDISYYDFIKLIKNWLIQFFPQYKVEVEEEVDYTKEEMWEMIKEEGLNPNDVLDMKKKEKREEVGIIERIILKNDEFIFNIDGDRFIRMSGTLGNVLPLSQFLKKLRPDNNLNDEEIRNYILNNSIEIKKYKDSRETIVINYPSHQMLNFFIINLSDMKDEKIVRTDVKSYRWGKFKIKFEHNLICKDCLKYVREKGVEIVE